MTALLSASAFGVAAQDKADVKFLEKCGFAEGDTIAVVPEGIVDIPPYAFLGCASIRKISLPKSLRKIGEGAFRECGSLRELVIPRGVTELPRYMCAWDTLLSKVELPFGLQDIGSHAFAYCESLESVNIPKTVTHIGSNAFSFCRSLTEVTVPDDMKELESYAFAECSSLRKAVLPANPNMLGEYIFSGCGNLGEIKCLSQTPPTFDCGSPLFDDSEGYMYKKCRLITLPKSRRLFEKSPVWNRFFGN